MRSKVLKIVLDGYGSYLGMEKGCFTVRNKEGNVKRYPLFENEIGEVILKSGNAVSVGALASMGFWGIDVLILSRKGKPVAMLKSIDDDSHVKTKLAQYEAYRNGKAIKIAKQIVYSKIESENIVLRKYGLEQHDLMAVKTKIENLESINLKTVRRKLLPIEALASRTYFKQIFKLFPKSLRAKKRKGWKAFDGTNNTFNLAYTLLKYKVHSAILKAKLEPFLGFLHSEQFGKPSLVCDLMELYRYLIDDFLIRFSQKLTEKDFVYKTEWFSSNKLGKRQVLNNEKTKELTQRLNSFFEKKIKISRVKYGKRQQIESLINEEACLLAKYLRSEKPTWKPRLPQLITNYISSS